MKYIYKNETMKYVFSLLAFTFLLAPFASSQDVTEVITAEKAFAHYALTQNVRDAFLQYIDSNAVVFENGEILNAKQVWTANTTFTGKLLWKPAFAGISQSGDLAFTTGPWEFRPSLTDSTVASGQFATVWIKTKSGEWKFLADIGIDVQQKMHNFTDVKIAGGGVKSITDTGKASKLEQELNQQMTKNGVQGLINASADDCWYIINKNVPLQGIAEIRRRAMGITPSKISFTPAHVKVATSGDLAYAYGYVTYGTTKENYLRVWQNTPKGWKMILLLIK
jgi:ketosteroid isomerase-like protein